MAVILKLTGVTKAAFNTSFDMCRDSDRMSPLSAALAGVSLQAVVDLAAAAGPAGHDVWSFDKCAHQFVCPLRS